MCVPVVVVPPEVDKDPEDEPELQMQLVWAHTATYPDEPPSIRLRSVKGLGDNDLQEATDELQRHIQVGVGMWGEGFFHGGTACEATSCCRGQSTSCSGTHIWGGGRQHSQATNCCRGLECMSCSDTYRLQQRTRAWVRQGKGCVAGIAAT